MWSLSSTSFSAPFPELNLMTAKFTAVSTTSREQKTVFGHMVLLNNSFWFEWHQEHSAPSRQAVKGLCYLGNLLTGSSVVVWIG